MGHKDKFNSSHARKKIKELCENGALYGYLHNAKSSNKIEDVGTCVALAINYHLQPIQPQFGNNQNFIQGYNLREEILKSISSELNSKKV